MAKSTTRRRGSAGPKSRNLGASTTAADPSDGIQEHYNVLLGKRVDLPYSQWIDCGTVAFVGVVSFAEGVWVGVNLDSAVGKNDGTVEGVQYFDAKPSCGIFVRPSRCKLALSGAYAHAFIEGKRSILQKRRESTLSRERRASSQKGAASPTKSSPLRRESVKKFQDKNLQHLYEEAQKRLEERRSSTPSNKADSHKWKSHIDEIKELKQEKAAIKLACE